MTEHKQRNVDSQRRFRATHRRIDFAPQPEIWAIIEEHFQGARVKSLTRVIDRLILAGHQAITGNSSEQGSPACRTEHIAEIQHRRLTPRQEAFACAVATGPNQSLTESYRQVYAPQNAKPGTINNMAARLAALPHVAARIGVLRGAVTAAALERKSYSLADAIREAGELAERATARGQIAAAVRAIRLRAQLAGHLPTTRGARRSKDFQQSYLEEGDAEALMKISEELRAQDAADLVGKQPPVEPSLQ